MAGATSSLNPCSNGMTIESERPDGHPDIPTRLNPCSNGMTIEYIVFNLSVGS